MKCSFACVIVLLFGGGGARAGAPWQPTWPSPEAYDLAELAKVRPLTRAEVALVDANWLTQFIYLEAALHASLLRGEGSSYLDLPNGAKDGCLNSILHQMLLASRDGRLEDSELAALWEANGPLAFYGYLIASDGQESAYILDRMQAAGYEPKAIRVDLVSRYFALREREPVDLVDRIDYIIAKTVMRPAVGSARLLELGVDAHDILWSRLQKLGPLSKTADPLALAKRTSLIDQVVSVLGSFNDPRIHRLSEDDLALMTREFRHHLAFLRASPAGTRGPRHHRGVLFTRALCHDRPVIRLAP